MGQFGAGNASGVAQLGAGNGSVVGQFGSDNTSGVLQQGLANFSGVVQLGEENKLHELMKEAFERVMKVNKVKVKYNKNMTKQDLYSSRHLNFKS